MCLWGWREGDGMERFWGCSMERFWWLIKCVFGVRGYGMREGR